MGGKGRTKHTSSKAASTNAPPDGQPPSICVRVPLTIRKRAGRKLIFSPDGTHIAATTAPHPADSAVIRALARAFRWRDMLESGDYATIREIAAAEKINETYIGRILRLTLLAPRIIEGIINGEQSMGLQLARLTGQFPVEWHAQSHGFGLLT